MVAERDPAASLRAVEIYIYRARGRQVYVTLVGPRFGVYVYFSCVHVLPMNGKRYAPKVSVKFSTPTVNAGLVYMYSFCARRGRGGDSSLRPRHRAFRGPSPSVILSGNRAQFAYCRVSG